MAADEQVHCGTVGRTNDFLVRIQRFGKTAGAGCGCRGADKRVATARPRSPGKAAASEHVEQEIHLDLHQSAAEPRGP
jgi:hypothetical protein